MNRGLAFATVLLALCPAAFAADALTDEQMAARATEAAVKMAKGAVVTPVASQNLHLGKWAIPNPLPDERFFCALLAHTPAAPRRCFIAVSRTGDVACPFKAEQLPALLAAADKTKWKDEDWLNAALLWAHLDSVANEDGWKLVRKPEDFLMIAFNMPTQGPAVPKREAAAKLIAEPKVERKDKTVAVTFHAWHLIGGRLCKWQIEFGPTADAMKATKEQLGAFGGGGYD